MRDVRGELNKIVAPVDVILRKLAERQVKLQNALLRSQEFQVNRFISTIWVVIITVNGREWTIPMVTVSLHFKTFFTVSC